MSRCFPYPPPGYSRNGATYEALIESIKLQKETDKAKAERKKEKRARKEKNEEKKKRKEEEKGKLQKKSNECQLDAHKVLQTSVDLHNKRTAPNIEQLEKSDLTEERGQPICSHKPSYSSDSTQNSNKRKRDDAVLPDGTTGHGRPFKIRLLKKHQGPDTSKETLCSNSGRTDPPSLCGADAKLNTWKLATSGNTDPSVPSVSNSVNGLRSKDTALLVSSNRKTGDPATSGRENNLQGVNIIRKQSPAPSSRTKILPSSQLKHEIPRSNSSKTKLPVPPQSRKSDVEMLHSSRRQPIPNPASNVLPPPSVSRTYDVQGFRSGTEQLTPASGIPVMHPLKQGASGSDSNKSKSSDTGKRSISTRMEETIPVPVEKVGPTRFEKKMQKKQLKYEKLVGSWVPPVMEAKVPDDDDDWLSGSGKRSMRSSRDDVRTCGESVTASSLWQPCARFLAEADIYALPFTVPF